MSPSGDDRATTADPAEAERAEHPDSFDPGPETGYLRRGHRDHDLDVDSGSAPFDPGADHYDDRRAKRAAKKAEKAERKRREREEKAQAAREQADRKAHETREAARRERAERARQVADEAARAERQHDEREELLREQRRRAREAEAEKADRAHADRERLREAERERAEQEREAGRHAKQAARERRDAELREERERIAAQRAKRDQAEREREQRRKPDPKSESRGQAAVAAPPKPKLNDLKLAPAGKPSPDPAAPALSHKPGHVSLRLPTAKVGAALLLVAAVAALAGSAAGLPIPILDGGSSSESSAESGVDPAALALLDSGTPVGLTKGPFHPVVGNVGYGESAAKFGASRGGRSHEGQDVFANPGTPLVAIRDGVVVDGAPENGRYSGGRGNYVVIYSQLDDRSYVYLHMLKPALVSKGDTVAAGQPLGQIGCTGTCFGPHLHFEVRNGRASLRAETKAVDPLPLLKQWPKVPVPGRS